MTEAVNISAVLEALRYETGLLESQIGDDISTYLAQFGNKTSVSVRSITIEMLNTTARGDERENFMLGNVRVELAL